MCVCVWGGGGTQGVIAECSETWVKKKKSSPSLEVMGPTPLMKRQGGCKMMEVTKVSCCQGCHFLFNSVF